MFSAGDSLELGATGARVVFRRTAAETGGRAVVFELHLPPSGHVPQLHVHPRQSERIEVLAGSVGALIGGRHVVVGAGARLSVPPGVAHRVWNAGAEPAHLVVEFTPALRTEAVLAAVARSEGRSPVSLSRVAAEHFETVRPAFPPVAVQRLAVALRRLRRR